MTPRGSGTAGDAGRPAAGEPAAAGVWDAVTFAEAIAAIWAGDIAAADPANALICPGVIAEALNICCCAI